MMDIPQLFNKHADGCLGDPCTCTTPAERESAARIICVFFGDLPEEELRDFEHLVLHRVRARLRKHEC